MAEVAMMTLAGVGGNAAGAYAANALGKALDGGGSKGPDIGEQITNLVNNMNGTLNQYLTKALDANNDYNSKARGTINQSAKSAQNRLLEYLGKASEEAKKNTMFGVNQSAAYNQPTISAGNAGRDALMDSLGLARPVVGSEAVQQSLLKQGQLQNAMSELGAYKGTAKPADLTATAPVWVKNPTFQEYSKTAKPSTNMAALMQQYGYGLNWSGSGQRATDAQGVSYDPQWGNILAQNDKTMQQRYIQDQYNTVTKSRWDDYLKQQKQYATQQSNYQSQLQKYNAENAAYQGQVQGINNQYAPSALEQSILQAYNQGYFGK